MGSVHILQVCGKKDCEKRSVRFSQINIPDTSSSSTTTCKHLQRFASCEVRTNNVWKFFRGTLGQTESGNTETDFVLFHNANHLNFHFSYFQFVVVQYLLLSLIILYLKFFFLFCFIKIYISVNATNTYFLPFQALHKNNILY